ncbi:MAG: redoxin domain-containing protein [Hyphomicrobiaceae bacterium]
MNDTKSKHRGSAKSPVKTYALVAALSGLMGFGAVYAILRPADNSKPQSMKPQPTAPAPSAANSLASGEMLTFVFKKAPEAVPAFKFEDGAGTEKTLADWKGKVVLLNLWATWCAPCRKEMPALDRLQKELGGDAFEVVAISVDRQGAPASKKFLEETKTANLKLYVESTSRSVGTLKAAGLPTTILIDKEGREVGRLSGPAEWDSADAKRLIQASLK